MNIDVCLVLDNPKRDLRGTVLLAYQLAKARLRVAIVPMYVQGTDLTLLNAKIVVLNYARHSNKALINAYKDAGIHVAVLDTEGGILSKSGLRSPSNWALSIKQTDLAGKLDKYFFWGSEVEQAFRMSSGIDLEKMHVTGCPRYDLCVLPWSQLLAYHRKNHILVNTNFSAINPAFTESHEKERVIFSSLGWDAEYIENLFSGLQALFPHYLDAVEKLATDLPDRLIQVRPHPFENRRTYESRFAHCPNIVVDGEGDPLNAIAQADCVVHLNCGTSVDAILLGKTPISMEFLNNEILRNHSPLPSELSCPATSQDHLLEMVKSQTARDAVFDLKSARKKIEPWFYCSDGKAAERITSVLTSYLIDPNNVFFPRGGFRQALRGGRKSGSIGQRVQGFACMLIGSKWVFKLRELVQPARKDKILDPKVVTKLMQQYALYDDGPQFTSRHARHPVNGMPMATVVIEAV